MNRGFRFFRRRVGCATDRPSDASGAGWASAGGKRLQVSRGERTAGPARSAPPAGRQGRACSLGCVALREPGQDPLSQCRHQFLFGSQHRLRFQVSIDGQTTGSVRETQVPAPVREPGMLDRHVILVKVAHVSIQWLLAACRGSRPSRCRTAPVPYKLERRTNEWTPLAELTSHTNPTRQRGSWPPTLAVASRCYGAHAIQLALRVPIRPSAIVIDSMPKPPLSLAPRNESRSGGRTSGASDRGAFRPEESLSGVWWPPVIATARPRAPGRCGRWDRGR
jgi:hypothetical protein